MAKITAANLAVLASVVIAMGNTDTPFAFVSTADAKNLISEGLVEQNGEIKDDAGNLATRATEKGVALHNSQPKNEGNNNSVDNANTASATPKFEIFKVEGAVFGTGRARKATSMYDFDGMDVGAFIFVPNSEDKPDAAKSLASTISSANKRFSTPTGQFETVTVKTYQVGADGKRVKDADGKLIPTGEKTEQREKLNPGKTFAVRPVEGGKAYGSWTAPASGAVILREA